MYVHDCKLKVLCDSWFFFKEFRKILLMAPQPWPQALCVWVIQFLWTRHFKNAVRECLQTWNKCSLKDFGGQSSWPLWPRYTFLAITQEFISDRIKWWHDSDIFYPKDQRSASPWHHNDQVSISPLSSVKIICKWRLRVWTDVDVNCNLTGWWRQTTVSQ